MLFINHLFDLIFPSRCVFCGGQEISSPLCNACAENILLAPVRSMKLVEFNDLDGVIVACINNPRLRVAVHALKYRMYKNVAEVLGKKLSQALSNQIVFSEFILMPVPLYFLRRWWRGFNQAEALAKVVNKNTFIPLASDVIKRCRHTISQVGLGRAERLKNLQHAFIVTNENHLIGKNILLIDDILTTGATLGECAKVLKKAGAQKVIGLVLSHGV
ncbi:MAG: ComF family protein [Patescibacteria group bacterium]|nr:ComF family protein [Patescibacteria group bacterium]